MNEGFLKRKFNLHNEDEVKKQVKRTKNKTGEEIKDADEKIKNYLNLFE